MRNYNYYFMALLAMLMLVSAPALAQSGARRNTTVTERQEANAERKQTKVNEAQKSTNVSSQSATDIKLRNPGGTSSDRRNGSSSDVRSGNGGAVNNSGNGNANHNGNANYNGNVNNGKSNGNNGNVGNNRPPVNNGNNGYNRPPVNNGGSFGGNYGGNYNGGHGGYPGGYGKNYPGYRPSLPTLRVYERTDIYYRTNASSIVLRTPFRTKDEAYRYVERLLLDSDYIIGTYGNGYSWIQSEACFIPTPYDWTDPMTHNQFRIKVSFAKSFGYVQVTISGDWRESILSSRYSILRFQPSNSYSTYYAWNVLEDLADAIPHSALSYR